MNISPQGYKNFETEKEMEKKTLRDDNVSWSCLGSQHAKKGIERCVEMTHDPHSPQSTRGNQFTEFNSQTMVF